MAVAGVLLAALPRPCLAAFDPAAVIVLRPASSCLTAAEAAANGLSIGCSVPGEAPISSRTKGLSCPTGSLRLFFPCGGCAPPAPPCYPA